MVEEKGGEARTVVRDGIVQWGGAETDGVRLRLVVEENHDHVGAVLEDGAVQRRGAEGVTRIGVGAHSQKGLSRREITILDGPA